MSLSAISLCPVQATPCPLFPPLPHLSLPYTLILSVHPTFRYLRSLPFPTFPTSIFHSLSSQRVYEDEQKSGKWKGEKGGEEEEEEEKEEEEEEERKVENEEEKEEGEEEERKGKEKKKREQQGKRERRIRRKA